MDLYNTIKLATGSSAIDPVVSATGRIPFSLEDPVYRKLMVEDKLLLR
jgi:hypothetical protein